jgi:hypothetical protein
MIILRSASPESGFNYRREKVLINLNFLSNRRGDIVMATLGRLDRLVLDGSAVPMFEEAMRQRLHEVLDWMLARKAAGIGLPARPEYDKELCELAALLGRYEPDQAWPERAVLTFLYSFDDIVSQGLVDGLHYTLSNPLGSLIYSSQEPYTTINWLKRAPRRETRPLQIPMPLKSQAWCDRVAELLQQRLDAIDPASLPGARPEPIDADLGEPLWRNERIAPLPTLPKTKANELRRRILCLRDLIAVALNRNSALLDQTGESDWRGLPLARQVALVTRFLDNHSFGFPIFDRIFGAPASECLALLGGAVRYEHHADQLSDEPTAMRWTHICIAMGLNDRPVLERWAANFEHVYKFAAMTTISRLVLAWIRGEPLPPFKQLKTAGKFDNAVIDALTGLVAKDAGNVNAGVSAMLQSYTKIDDLTFQYRLPGAVCLQAVAIQRAALGAGLSIDVPRVAGNDPELVHASVPAPFSAAHLLWSGAQAMVDDPSPQSWPTLFLNRRVREIIDPTAKPEPPKPIEVTNRMVLEAIEKSATEPVSIVLAHMPRAKPKDLAYKTSEVLRDAVGRRWTSAGGYGVEQVLDGFITPRGSQSGLHVQLKDAKWIHFWGPSKVTKASQNIAKAKELSVLLLSYDPAGKTWGLVLCKQGKCVAAFTGGSLASPVSVANLKCKAMPASMLKGCTSVCDALDRLLAKLEVQVRLMHFARTPKLRLSAADGGTLEPADISDATVVEYVEVTPEEDPLAAELETAIEAGDVKTVQRCVKAGANLKCLPGSRCCALSYAILNRKEPRWLDCVRVLLDAGESIDGSERENPAIVAAIGWDKDEEKEIALLRELLSRGADINSRATMPNDHGGTALHRAVWESRPATARFLLENGADPHAKNAGDRKPADLVGHPNLVRTQERQTDLKEMLLAAERGEPLPGASVEQMAQTSAAERTRAKQNLGSVFESVFAAMALKQQIESDPEHATPEQVAWLIALSQPPTMKLTRVGKPTFKAMRKIEAITRQMVDAGFEEVGTYKTAEIEKLLIIGFVHPAHRLYGAVYEFAGAHLVDVVRVHQDGSIITATTMAPPPVDLGSPKQFKKIRRPEGSPQALVDAVMMSKPSVSEPIVPTSEGFVKSFVRAYEDLAGHQRNVALKAFKRSTQK